MEELPEEVEPQVVKVGLLTQALAALELLLSTGQKDSNYEIRMDRK
jgi:hypothetical protein